MKKMKKEIKIGIFACVVVMTTVFAIEFLKGRDLFSRDRVFYTCYDAVDGVGVSTQVTLQGYRVGEVTSIEYDKEKRKYNLEVIISRDYEIPSDSYLELYSMDLLGTKGLAVIMGDSPEFAQSGSRLEGTFRPDLLSTLASEVAPTKKAVDSLLANLNEAVSSVNLILDDNNRREIAGILSGVRRSVENLSSIMSGIESNMPDIESIISNLDSITTALDASSASFSNTISNAEEITMMIRESELKESIASFRQLLDQIQDKGGSIGKLLTTDSLYNSIYSLSKDLDSLVKRIEKDPKKYLKISVF